MGRRKVEFKTDFGHTELTFSYDNRADCYPDGNEFEISFWDSKAEDRIDIKTDDVDDVKALIKFLQAVVNFAESN